VTLAALVLLAFFAAVVAGTLARINIGLLSIALAFAIGVPFAGLSVQQVAGGFPVGLFLTLVAVTLLFSLARSNGTLGRIAALSVRVCSGRAGLIPVAFFGLALLLASLGPGNIAAVALLAPVAMNAASRAGISPFLMALMVCSGANAGAFSPVAPTGVIAAGLMAQTGLAGHEWRTFFVTLLAQSLVAFAGYLVFGGARLLARPAGGLLSPAGEAGVPFAWRQWLTLAVLSAVVLGVMLLKLDVSAVAFGAAAVLALLRAADTERALEEMPWGTILLVCGVSVLIALVARTGGMDLFAGLLAGLSTERSITAVIGFVTGAVSVYSSSSGVVMPAFLPMVPALVAKLGGGDPLAIASAINVGSHLVDVSPLSTLGALCIAAARKEPGRVRLFNQMLAWGVSMSVVGAGVCWLLFGR
jgi:di/tricarboxylate transporter